MHKVLKNQWQQRRRQVWQLLLNQALGWRLHQSDHSLEGNPPIAGWQPHCQASSSSSGLVTEGWRKVKHWDSAAMNNMSKEALRPAARKCRHWLTCKWCESVLSIWFRMFNFLSCWETLCKIYVQLTNLLQTGVSDVFKTVMQMKILSLLDRLQTIVRQSVTSSKAVSHVNVIP